MAGARKRFTMQRVESSVSAAGQGEKAGPQASSSSDRSSILVGDLANVELNATRKRPEVSQSHDCYANHDNFCYVCSKYEVTSLQKSIDNNICNLYQSFYF